MKNSLFKKWEIRPNGFYIPSYQTTSRLPAGVYQIICPPGQGFQLKRLNIVTEKIVDIPMHEFKSIFDDIDAFWERGSIYKENSMVYKRGILLFGKPGTGKSFVIQRLIKQLIEEKDGVVITITSPQCLENYISFTPEIYREIEPHRPTMVILEEVDELLYRGYSVTLP